MSFICPSCGFRDSACWRNSHWFLYTQTCKIDDLDSFEPGLAKELREKKQLTRNGYYYKLSKFGRVYRVPEELKGEYTRGHWQEKPKSPFQKKLEVSGQ